MRLPLSCNGGSQRQKKILESSADKQIRNYDIEYSDYHSSISTWRPNGFTCSKIKWWAICTKLPVNHIVRIPRLRDSDSQDQKRFLPPCAEKQTSNYDIEYSNRHASISTLSRSKIRWWAIYTTLPVKVIVRPSLHQSGGRQGKEMFLVPHSDKQTHNYDIEGWPHHPSLSTLTPNGWS